MSAAASGVLIEGCDNEHDDGGRLLDDHELVDDETSWVVCEDCMAQSWAWMLRRHPDGGWLCWTCWRQCSAA